MTDSRLETLALWILLMLLVMSPWILEGLGVLE